MKTIILSAVFVSIFFTACTVNYTYTNRKEDVQDGQKILFKFYDDIYNKRFDELNTMASDTIKQTIGNTALADIAKKVNMNFGKYLDFLFTKSYTQKKEGAASETLYQFVLKVTYEKGVLNEVVNLKKFKNGIKITNYEIYSKPIASN